MSNHQLSKKQENELATPNIKIIDIDKIDEFVFIILENGQKIFTDGKKIYNFSNYNHFINKFIMNNKTYIVLVKGFATQVVMDLDTQEIIYESDNAFHISKQDDRTLHIITNTSAEKNQIYDIETKRHLKIPSGYEFEYSLGNNLYVFAEQNPDISFYEQKRCVINADGKTLINNITGFIHLSDSHLIITKDDELLTIELKNEETITVNTIKQTSTTIAKPKYYNGNILIIEKGSIKLYSPNLELIKEIKIAELETIIDFEITSNILKLCLPLTLGEKQVNKHLFINLETKKSISSHRIEGYPYWHPTTYIGTDYTNEEIKAYNFYNSNFEKILTIDALSYESVDVKKEHIFFIKTKDANHLLNTEKQISKEVPYDYVLFHTFHPYGYGVNQKNETIDFFDEELNVIFPNFKYKDLGLNFTKTSFSYFIINDYICLIKHIVNDSGQSKYRNIIMKSTGEILLDSIGQKCFALGNFIQIIDKNGSQFLNTETGEIGQLSITAKTDEDGNIYLDQTTDINYLLTVNNIKYLAPSKNEKTKKKTNKFNLTPPI